MTRVPVGAATELTSKAVKYSDVPNAAASRSSGTERLGSSRAFRASLTVPKYH